jgi:hypothetical protein
MAKPVRVHVSCGDESNRRVDKEVFVGIIQVRESPGDSSQSKQEPEYHDQADQDERARNK